MARLMWKFCLLSCIAATARGDQPTPAPPGLRSGGEQSALSGIRSSACCPCAACAGKAEENWLDTIEPPESCECGSGLKLLQRMRQRPCVAGLDHCFNCNCRGSYKHPVPPQSTYHWPGMYGAPMMTASISPWQGHGLRRFREVRDVATQPLERVQLLRERPLPAPAEASMSRAMRGVYR